MSEDFMPRPSAVFSADQLDDGLIEAWSDLHRQLRLSYFAGPEWILAWLAHFAVGSPTAVAVWHEGGKLAAVAPMVCIREPLIPSLRRPTASAWRNAGSIEASGDHLGFTCDERYMAATLGWARGLGHTVRLAHFDSRWSALLGVERPRVEPTFRSTIENGEVPGSKKLWSQIRNKRRRLVDIGAAFEITVGAAIKPEHLAELFQLHGVRSDAKERATSFSVQRAPFVSALAARSRPGADVVLVRVLHEGVAVGSLLGFADTTTFSYYQSGWSPEYVWYKLGHVLIAEAIKYTASQGLSSFDFLRGADDYKTRFGAERIDDVSSTVYVGPSGLALQIADEVRRKRSHHRESRRD